MATIPTPEESAREILSIFVQGQNSRPGDALPTGVFMTNWHPRNAADFNTGIAYAIQQGWVSHTNNGYRLEQKGFDEA